MNKLILLIFPAYFMLITVYSQSTIEFTFAADYNEQYVSLDSIFIENLTRGGDTTLYAPDTVLVLDYVTSIGDYLSIRENSFAVSQNYPNPYSDQTKINIYLPEREKVEFFVHDILGREVVYYKDILKGGNHTYTLYLGNEKFYLFIVKGESTIKTIKMLNANSDFSFGGTSKIVYNGSDKTMIDFKSQKAINNFGFVLGDQLRYTGYAKTINYVMGSDVISDASENSQSYSFEITEGIPCHGIPTITYKGNVYETVLIGDQCWMKENLNVGFRIEGSVLVSDNGVIEKYCYEDDIVNCELYGALYHWKEMMLYNSIQGIQGICPDGWHLPTDIDWTTLANYLGGGDIAGGKLKEMGTNHWFSPNTAATNETGFLALPGGGRYNHGGYQNFGIKCDFWSSTADEDSDASFWNLKSNNSTFNHGVSLKANCYSVRCIMD